MNYTHFILVTLLVSLMRLDGAQGPCPPTCHCTLEIFNCSSPPAFHQVLLPNPAPPLPHPFVYLDYTGHAISSTEKEVWKVYPWTKCLVLKDNNLMKLQNSSLEGFLPLTYLDLSCNKIQIIERNAFEAVLFLHIIYLSGNVIEWIANGTFQAWQGMPFLLKVDLNHIPLAVVQDSYFYRLPSLKFLALSVTKVTPTTLEDLLLTSQMLSTLIMPRKMSCCLCRIKEDAEVLCNAVKLECTESCDINATLYKKEELLNGVQEEVVKVLENRKLSGTTLLNILPEKAIPNNAIPERIKHNNDTLAQNCSRLTATFNLLKLLEQLMRVKSLDVNWADKGELKKLYLLVSLLQRALKETIMEREKDSQEAIVLSELSTQDSKKSTDEATNVPTDASLRKEGHVRKGMRKTWFGRNQRQKDILFRLSRDRQQVATTTMQSAVKSGDSELHNEAESWRKLAEGLDSQGALPFLRSHQMALQPPWKHSVSDSSTNALNPTSSSLVDKNDNDLTSLSNDGKSFRVLGDGFRAQILTKEELLNQLPSPAGNGKSRTSAIDSEPSLNELLSDIMLSQGTHWDNQRTSASPLLNLAPQDDYFHQRDLFEAEVNKQITFLIPNASMRKFMSQVIRILKMDCTKPALQIACAKLISRTGLLMTRLRENDKTSSLWKSSFWPPENVASLTKASSKKREKPSGRTGSQGIPVYWYENKLFSAISVTIIILIIIAIVCLVEICTQRFAAKELPPPPPPQKPTVKRGSDAAGGTSEATCSKAASSAADEGADEDEEDAEKSEKSTTVAKTEAPERGEAEGAEEEGDEDEESDYLSAFMNINVYSLE